MPVLDPQPVGNVLPVDGLEIKLLENQVEEAGLVVDREGSSDVGGMPWLRVLRKWSGRLNVMASVHAGAMS